MPPRSRPLRAADVGEFPLIDRLLARVPALRPDVLVGAGDDVAVVSVSPEECLLVTCDVQVAGSHFRPDATDPSRLGRKAAAINLSDIAATGGRPAHFLVSLIVPPETEVGFLEAVYEGLAKEAARWGADVIGGNVSRGSCLAIDLTLLGTARPDRLLRRAGARPGDLILVTGRLGAAAAGLHLALHPGTAVDEGIRTSVLAAFETPVPRLDEAAALVAAQGVTAMIDISDGLAADLGHLCDAGGLGVRVHASAVPVDDATAAVAAAARVDPLRWALGGGEDYELLFTAPAHEAEVLADAVLAATGTPVSVVGEMVAPSRGRRLVLGSGREAELTREGWRHF